MSEIPNKSLDDLAAQEQWAVDTARYVSTTFETKVGFIEYDTCLLAARFACLWVEEFKVILETGEQLPDLTPRSIMLLAEQRAMARAESLNRYPSGVPTLKTTIASWYAFAAAFGSEADTVFEIISATDEQ